MVSFIGQLVEELLEQHKDDLDQLCVVFPSKRACVFFKDALTRSVKGPTWSPGVFAIEDFVREIHPRTLLDQVSLTFELYPIYKEYFPNEPFDKYYSWGSMLIGDFDEIDLHKVDAGQLFRNLYDLKEIDTTIDAWLNEDGKLSSFQEGYLKFWNLMGELYKRLHHKLDQRGMASPGMAMREIADEFSKKAPKIPWDKVVFAGFNALAPAEESLIRSLVHHGMAECYWDLDRYYVDDPHQEAGAFFREMRDRWKTTDWKWIGENLSKAPKHITVTGVPQRVGQAKVAGLKLAELLEEHPEGLENTAVVLPDEGLLFPLLHSLPQGFDKINVTMGYPLRNTPLYSLVESIIQLHENADRLRPGEKSSIFYFRDVMSILRHPYVHSILREESRELLREIAKENLVYISPKYFEAFEEQEPGHFLSFLFQRWEHVTHAIDFFLDLYRKLKVSFEVKGRKTPTIEAEYLFHFFTLTQKLRDKLDAYAMDFELRIFRRLYRDVIQGGSIPFSGEPLEGLQVMGMLETRILDFDRLIVLSVNEGVLPAKPNLQSFIPYSLRKEFGLPTHEDKDAIYAYHFYRLMQRSKEVTLIYNTEPDTFGSGEKSRFIAQMEAELELRNPNAVIKQETITFPSGDEDSIAVEVPKVKAVLDRLTEYATEKGFSPSALSTYLNCPLQFYYQNLMRLYEKEEAEESMEEHTFGKVLHGTLEVLYGPYKDKVIQPDDIRSFGEQLEGVIEAQFKLETRTENHKYGRNRLLLGVIRNLVEKLLEIDVEDAPFLVLGLEEELETLVRTIRYPDGVKLRGFIDRIDVVDGMTRIIDYKTGKVKRLDLKGFEEIREGGPKREAFQLSTYAYLYLRNAENPDEVKPGIYFMRNLSDGFQPLKSGPTQAETLDLESLLDYESELVNLLDEVFDPEQPFVQTEDPDRCRFCAYTGICVRG